MIEIKNVDELKQFITDHYDTLTDSEYMELIRSAFDVISMGKPDKLETAIEDINRTCEFLSTLKPNEEKPIFFIEQEVIPFEFKQILTRVPTRE